MAYASRSTTLVSGRWSRALVRQPRYRRIVGLIARGYSDTDIAKIAGGNALDFFRRVMA